MKDRTKTNTAKNNNHAAQYPHSCYIKSMRGYVNTQFSNTMAICLGSFMVMLIVVMNYLIYFDQFHFFLLMIAIIGALLHFLKLVYQIFDIVDNTYHYRDSIDPLLGLMLSAVLGWLVSSIVNAMPLSILVFAEQFVTGSKHYQNLKLWQHYNGTEHRIILQSMCATLFVLIGLVSNLFYGLMKVKRLSSLISAIAIFSAYLLVCLYT